MFTPAPPKSAVPGRRGQGVGADGGSRAVSPASLRPTVSALATYRTPSPYLTSGKDVDVSSIQFKEKENLESNDLLAINPYRAHIMLVQ